MMTRRFLLGGSSAVGFSAVSQGVPVWKKALFVDSHFSFKCTCAAEALSKNAIRQPEDSNCREATGYQ